MCAHVVLDGESAGGAVLSQRAEPEAGEARRSDRTRGVRGVRIGLRTHEGTGKEGSMGRTFSSEKKLFFCIKPWNKMKLLTVNKLTSY